MATSISITPYRQALHTLQKQVRNSRFVRWWLGELATLLPAGLRPVGLDAAAVTLLMPEGPQLCLRRFEQGKLHELGQIALSDDLSAQRQALLAALEPVPPAQRDLVLVLPRQQVLKKHLTLPLATEENLQQVLAFQMDQLTPFAAAQVYFAYRVLARDFERSVLTLEFVATPRTGVDAMLKRLQDWGVKARAAVVEDMLHTPDLLNLLPTTSARTHWAWLSRSSRWLLGLVALLAVAAVVLPIAIQREAVVQLLPWVDKAKRAAEEVDRVRRELEIQVEEHNYLLAKKQALAPVLATLEELARILPDDTWVQQIDIKGKELQIQGETASSVRLIALFENAQLLREAGFRSPLTKGQTAGAERYQLALEIQPMPAMPATPASAPASSTPAVVASAPASAPASAAASGPQP